MALTVRITLALLAGCLGTVHAATGVLTDPSEDELLHLLDPPPVARSFSLAPRPSSTDGSCLPTTVSGAGAATGSASRNLVVVPYAADEGASVNLAIEFDTGSDKIKPASRPLLTRLAKVLASTATGGARFAVAGHTDATGSTDLNLRLSCARALAVHRQLLREGVPEGAIWPYGFGRDKPLDPGGGASARNRRVEIRRAD
ncbi:OmpA family protein [Sphaerotilus mobilis]|nr:OmpA family protein [Sphaerotilus mobilis]